METAMTITLTLLLRIAGALHLVLMGAGLLMPRVVRMRWHLATLPPFIRQLFWVYYSFIALCLVSFSVITIAFADTLAAGGNLARALCTFFAVFWTLRLIAGTFVFDMRPYLTNRYRRLGYHALNLVFAYLPVVYLLAESQPRWLK
jgi:FtsH-binding integral membrane protein